MLNRTLETAARARWALPVALLVALSAMVVNEITYRHSHSTLTRNITIADARINAARLLQELTDAEFAVVSYLRSGDAERLADWQRSSESVPAAHAVALTLLLQVEPAVAAQLETLLGALHQRMDHLADWVAMAQRGQREQARALSVQGVPGQELSALRAEYDTILTRAAAAHQVARRSLFDAMMTSRVSVHGLVLLSVLGLTLFVRQLRSRDAERKQEQLWLEDQVRARTLELRELAGHLVSAREDERARVARELHDEMGGLLTAIKLEFARLKRVAGVPEAALARVQGIEARLNDGIALKRRIVENLRPSSLDQLGLRPALQLLCDDMALHAGFAMETVLQELPLGKEVELTLYRLVQESLTNAIKYAQARQVWVRLRANAGRAELEVQDDGRGFDPTLARPGHHGLTGMRTRAESHGGSLVVHSQPGKGTLIRALVPLASAQA